MSLLVWYLQDTYSSEPSDRHNGFPLFAETTHVERAYVSQDGCQQLAWDRYAASRNDVKLILISKQGSTPFGLCDVMRLQGQYSLLIMDCSRAKWSLQTAR